MTKPDSPTRRASLIARHTLADALAALREAAAYLSTNGWEPVVEVESARLADLDSRVATVPRERLGERVDAVIAFGGDGTLLDAASAVSHSAFDAPLLGVNLGHLGFLTDVGRSEMLSALDRLIAGRTTTETRLLLSGRVTRQGRVHADHLALNDIVVTRSALSRMIEMTVDVDGQFLCHVKADGLIVSTATGLTAYNLSVGGPIVHPSVDALVLTPIAPHTLTHRPLVLPATAEIHLRPIMDSHSELITTFDGQFGIPLLEGDVVRIARAPRLLRLARTSSRRYFEMLRQKLKWGNA